MKMADTGDEGAGFWLPSEFFDDFLTDEENSDDNNVAESDSDSDFCFPAEFPYETQMWCVMSTSSPQSTMVHAGSWSGRNSGGSSDATKDAVEDLIHRAAGQVSKIKLHGSGATRPVKNTGLFAHPRSLDHLRPAARNPNHSVFRNVYLQRQRIGKQQQKQSSGIWYSEPQMYEMGQEAWPVHHNPTRVVGSGHAAVLLGGSVGGGGGGAAVKRKSAGTGVFLPRRFGNINDCNAYSDSPQKPGYSAFVPEHNVYVLNKNVDNINGFVQSRPHFTRRLNPDYDLLMARRNAVMFATSAKLANRMLVSDHEPWLVPLSRADIGSFPVL